MQAQDHRKAVVGTRWVCLKISTNTLCRFERHQKECEGDERPKWAREAPVLNPGEDKEVLRA